MSNAGGVIGAIAAHTVITSTIRNQQEEVPEENPMTQEELSQASSDFMRHYIKSVYWGLGGMVTVIGLFTLLIHLTS